MILTRAFRRELAREALNVFNHVKPLTCSPCRGRFAEKPARAVGRGGDVSGAREKGGAGGGRHGGGGAEAGGQKEGEITKNSGVRSQGAGWAVEPAAVSFEPSISYSSLEPPMSYSVRRDDGDYSIANRCCCCCCCCSLCCCCCCCCCCCGGGGGICNKIAFTNSRLLAVLHLNAVPLNTKNTRIPTPLLPPLSLPPFLLLMH